MGVAVPGPEQHTQHPCVRTLYSILPVPSRRPPIRRPAQRRGVRYETAHRRIQVGRPGGHYNARAPPSQDYGSVREPTSHLTNPAGGPSPQIGRHRESISGPPDPRTEALPTALGMAPIHINIHIQRMQPRTVSFICRDHDV